VDDARVRRDRALAAGLIATVVTLALVVWMAETAEVQSGTFLFAVAVRDRSPGLLRSRRCSLPCCSSLVGTAAATP